MRPAVFFDRDGTLNVPPEPGGYITRVDELRLAASVAEGVRLMAEAGYFLALITNQQGVAKRLMTQDDLTALHVQLQRLLFLGGGHKLDAMYAATGDKSDPRRKPSPAMILEAQRDHDLDLSESWLVGDDVRDIGAALAAGVRPILIEGRQSFDEIGLLAPEVDSKVIKVRDFHEAIWHIAEHGALMPLEPWPRRR